MKPERGPAGVLANAALLMSQFTTSPGGGSDKTRLLFLSNCRAKQSRGSRASAGRLSALHEVVLHPEEFEILQNHLSGSWTSQPSRQAPPSACCSH